MPEKTVHQGRNLHRIMKILDVKQEALALTLGDDWNQQKISLLVQKEEIDPKLLEQVAKALKVTPDAIKNFSEEAAVSIISNTFNDNAILNGVNYYPTFNPVDKVVELYERLVKEKDDLIAKLQKGKK